MRKGLEFEGRGGKNVLYTLLTVFVDFSWYGMGGWVVEEGRGWGEMGGRGGCKVEKGKNGPNW